MVGKDTCNGYLRIGADKTSYFSRIHHCYVRLPQSYVDLFSLLLSSG